jgi:hypothetical protein
MPEVIVDATAVDTTRTDAFLRVSVALTGFDRVALLGTGMVDDYLRTLEQAVPADVLDTLLAAADADVSALLDDATVGPVAQEVIVLWYCGTWDGAPVSPDAYVAGLQWVAAGAHPIGARQQGFGSWAVAPERTR